MTSFFSKVPCDIFLTHYLGNFDGLLGLAGKAVPLLARVLQVADVYDALTTERPYKRALSMVEALDTMQAEVGRGWWDPEIFDIFADLARSGFLHSSNVVEIVKHARAGALPAATAS